MVVVKGRREELPRSFRRGLFSTKELYWGGFARTIVLPEEIDVDSAEATGETRSSQKNFETSKNRQKTSGKIASQVGSLAEIGYLNEWWCRGPGSNRRPLPLQANALPTELPRHIMVHQNSRATKSLLWECVVADFKRLSRVARYGRIK